MLNIIVTPILPNRGSFSTETLNPSQVDVEAMLIFEKKQVQSGTNLNIPVELPPPTYHALKLSDNRRRVHVLFVKHFLLGR